MSRVGALLGTLTPGVGFPRDGWAEELRIAAEAGYRCVEWLDDAVGADINPLNTPAGQARIREAAAANGLSVPSLYAGWFMTNPFVRAAPADLGARLERLRALLARCAGAGIGRVVIPCVGQASVTTSYDEILMAEVLRALKDDSTRHRVAVQLQSDLDPARLAAFLERIGDDDVKIAYDIGTSAAHGYRPEAEFAAYGDRIGSVHVSDCIAFGTPVPLGEGIADLGAVFDGLGRLGFSGDFIVRTEPPPAGGATAMGWATKNLAIVNQYRSVRA